jgi:putative proteasome-type protease
MTYCLAMHLDAGLVFCSDSRTNAGPDRVSVYSKLHRFSFRDNRQIAILTAGNLGTTQAVTAAVERDLKTDRSLTIFNAGDIETIADYIGELSVQIQRKYAPGGGEEAGFNAEATFLIGGQIKGEEPELYLVYPEGNHIRASNRHPFLQSGEIKYGKPIIDRIVRRDTPVEIAMRCALVSMDSTMRSNATVGPPIELLFLRRDDFTQPAYYRLFEENDDYLLRLRESWDENIRIAFSNLPTLEYDDQED